MAARRRTTRRKATRKAPKRRARKTTRRTTRRRTTSRRATRAVGGNKAFNAMLKAHKEEITLIMLFLVVLVVFGYIA